MLKKIILFFFSAVIFAETTTSQLPNSCSIETKCENIKDESYLPSARGCLKNLCENRRSGFIGSLDFIYFQAKEDGMAFALKYEQDSFTPYSTNYNYKKGIYPSFDFKPGFKVALGFYIPRLTWEAVFKWTNLTSHTKKEVSFDLSNQNGLIPLFFNPSILNENSFARFSHAEGKFKMYLNTLDFEMADSFFVSQNIYIRIAGGVKGAIIHHCFYADYLNGSEFFNHAGETVQFTASNSTFKSDSKGMGPRIGLESNWKIYTSNFNLYASGFMSFLLTRFDMRFIESDYLHNSTQNADLYNEFKIHEYIWVVLPVAEMTFGIKWNQCVGTKKDYNLSFKAAYEFQYFYEQNLFRKLVEDQNEGYAYPIKGDLFLHGLVLSGRLEF